MASITLTAENFQETVENNDMVLIDFWADWCGPCKSFGPVFEKVSEAHPDIVFAKCDTEHQRELAAHFGIRSIPTLAIFRERVLLFSQAGAVPESALHDIIGQVKSLDMDQVRAEIEQARKEDAKG